MMLGSVGCFRPDLFYSVGPNQDPFYVLSNSVFKDMLVGGGVCSSETMSSQMSDQ